MEPVLSGASLIAVVSVAGIVRWAERWSTVGELRDARGGAQSSGESTAELTSEVLNEGTDPDGFFGQLRAVRDIELTPTLGVAEVGPVRCLVAGSPKTRSLDEGLDQHRSISVSLLPVIGEPARRHAE